MGVAVIDAIYNPLREAIAARPETTDAVERLPCCEQAT